METMAVVAVVEVAKVEVEAVVAVVEVAEVEVEAVVVVFFFSFFLFFICSSTSTSELSHNANKPYYF
jgi:hypothetical protein